MKFEKWNDEYHGNVCLSCPFKNYNWLLRCITKLAVAVAHCMTKTRETEWSEIKFTLKAKTLVRFNSLTNRLKSHLLEVLKRKLLEAM